MDWKGNGSGKKISGAVMLFLLVFIMNSVIMPRHTTKRGVFQRDICKNNDNFILICSRYGCKFVCYGCHDFLFCLRRAVRHSCPINQYDRRVFLSYIFRLPFFNIDINVFCQRTCVGANLLRNEIHEFLLYQGFLFSDEFYFYDWHNFQLLLLYFPNRFGITWILALWIVFFNVHSVKNCKEL